ncbi:MAG TPA: hypothetical protein VM287_16610, partial [Egibacteraceae bacterium]|nr:hypothetical protein [Egibacteraceae bacterium]
MHQFSSKPEGFADGEIPATITHPSTSDTAPRSDDIERATQREHEHDSDKQHHPAGGCIVATAASR